MARRSSLPLGQLVRLLPARWRPWAAILLVVGTLAFAFFQQRHAPPPAQPGEKPAHSTGWQRLEGCRLVDHPANDGDSVHMSWQGQDYIFRLYFVDTAETDKSLRDRIAEQAQYWGITPEQTVALGKRAIAFTATQLGRGQRDLTVQTRWRDALGRSKQGRSYAFIADQNGRDLGEQLVSEGLARIYGMKTDLPDGTRADAYLQRLHQAERMAKRARRGAWALSGSR